MRVVRDLDELAGAVRLASDEAASAFGDPTVFCERYVERGRHVEVQVVGDTHGTILVVGERDCSLQRRHQKVVEEAPAPGLSEPTRSALHDAARTAGEAIGYVGAGTVEFLVDGDRFFFLEMNTRLQVEHPVTECVTGLDLVALQIAVAEGDTVPDATPPVHGHAVEARLYAEDPRQGWQPQSGRLTRFHVPGVTAEFANPPGYGVRLDSGVQAGNEVGTFYDAMLAKVVAWAPTRPEAMRRLAGTLAKARIHGLTTNRDLLQNLLRDPVVLDAGMHTGYLDGLDPSATACNGYDEEAVDLAGYAAAFADVERRRRVAGVQRRIPPGWRNVTSTPQQTRFGVPAGIVEGDGIVVHWHGGRDGLRPADGATTTVETSPDRVVLERDGVRHAFAVDIDGDRFEVDSVFGHVALVKLPRFGDPADQIATGSLLAPMPGSVVAVHAAPGDRMRAGQPVLVLEAMKMQHTVAAPYEGVLVEVDVTVGSQVSAGQLLARLDNEVNENGALP